MNPVTEIQPLITNLYKYQADSEQPHPLPATDDEKKSENDVQKEIKPKPDIAIIPPKWY